MKKTVVVYESKYGYTKQYANWIAAALSCPVYERKNFYPANFASYDVIVYGGGLYAGGISGLKLLTRNWDLVKNKQVILFTCGLADPNNPDNVAHIKEAMSKTISPEILQNIAVFHLRGGIDYSRLRLPHRMMMAMLRKMLLKKEPCDLTSEDRELLATYGKSMDFTDQKSIAPLVKYIL